MADQSEAMRARLIGLLEAAGFPMTECPVLVPSDTVLDLVGPQTRGRLYLTQGIGGREWCLRPEFTISIAATHIADGDPARPARYGYCGPVFRKRPQGSGEFLQAGAESIGNGSRSDADADADIVVLAWKACSVFGVEPLTVFGDEALFTAVLSALDLPALWRRRLRAAFGDATRLATTLDAMDTSARPSESEANPGPTGGRLAGLSRLDPETAQSVVGEMIGLAPWTSIAGRDLTEITERARAKAQSEAGSPDLAQKAETLRDYLALACPIAEATDGIRAFGERHRIDLSRELGAFDRRHARISEQAPDGGEARFQASFGRSLDYYTGLIFDVFDQARQHPGPVCGGGRYDGLAERLGAPGPVPAVGFSLWLDRLIPEDAA